MASIVDPDQAVFVLNLAEVMVSFGAPLISNI